MPVATPLSLNNIVTEFGVGKVATNTYNSGSGSVTAPSIASALRVKAWGGGGGGGGAFGNVGTGGGGGAFVLKDNIAVTGGSTSVSYAVGAKGDGAATIEDGQNGGSSTVTVSSVTYTAGGGQGGKSDGFNPGVGGTASNGDINESGQTTYTQDGGDAGGLAYGGGTGGVFDLGTAPGGGGAGDEQGGNDGAAGRVTLEWLGKALSSYYRGGGSIPSHSANLNIPTSTTNLAISQFSGAELNFSATVTVGDNGGGVTGQYGYRSGSFGSINRDKVGLNRLDTSQGTIVNLYEFGVFNGLFTNYYLILEFNTNVTYSALGYHFFSSITVNGTTFNRTNAATNQNGVYSGGVTTWDWISGVSRLLPTSGTYPVSLAFSGP